MKFPDVSRLILEAGVFTIAMLYRSIEAVQGFKLCMSDSSEIQRWDLFYRIIVNMTRHMRFKKKLLNNE